MFDILGKSRISIQDERESKISQIRILNIRFTLYLCIDFNFYLGFFIQGVLICLATRRSIFGFTAWQKSKIIFSWILMKLCIERRFNCNFKCSATSGYQGLEAQHKIPSVRLWFLFNGKLIPNQRIPSFNSLLRFNVLKYQFYFCGLF